MSPAATSVWQALLAIACQWKINPTQPVLSQIDKGRENHRLKSEKQFIQQATALLRSLTRSCLREPRWTFSEVPRFIR
jgi:hypothetical protein